MKIIGKFFSAFLSVLLSLVIIVSVISLVGIRSVNRFVSADVLSPALEDIDVSALMGQYAASESPRDDGYLIGKLTQSGEIKKLLIDYLAGYPGYIATGKDEFDLTDIPQSVRKEFADIFIDYVVHMIETDPTLIDLSAAVSSLTVPAWLDLSAIDSSLLGSYVGQWMEKERAGIEEGAAEALRRFIPSYGELNESLDLPQETLDDIRFFLSDRMQWRLILIAAVSTLFIAAARFSLYKWLAWDGFALLFSGILLLTAALSLSRLTALAVQDPVILSVTAPLTQAFRGILIPCAAGLLAAAVLMIALYFIIRGRRRVGSTY